MRKSKVDTNSNKSASFFTRHLEHIRKAQWFENAGSTIFAC